MKSLLEQLEPVEHLIRQLHKIDSKLQAGQFIAAYRDVRRLISVYEQHKDELIKNTQDQKEQGKNE